MALCSYGLDRHPVRRRPHERAGHRLGGDALHELGVRAGLDGVLGGRSAGRPPSSFFFGNLLFFLERAKRARDAEGGLDGSPSRRS